MEVISQKKFMVGVAGVVIAAWLIAGVPWAANTLAEEAAADVTDRAMEIHEASSDHTVDVRQLEINTTATNEKISAMKEQLTRVESSVERLIQFQLER